MLPATRDSHTAAALVLAGLAQAAAAYGIGVLVGDKMREAERRVAMAVAFGAAGAMAVALLAGAVGRVAHRPGSRREMKRRLATIREGSGLSEDAEAF